MSAIAKRKSAEGTVDEKSVGKIPHCAGPSKAGKVHGPTGSSKGSGGKPPVLWTSGPYGHPSSQPPWPETRFAACSGRVADFTCLLAEYAIRTFGGVGGLLSNGESYPVRLSSDVMFSFDQNPAH